MLNNIFYIQYVLVSLKKVINEKTKIMKIDEIKTLEQFQMFLNDAPGKTKTNQLANNSLYVPIAEVEKTLDELYAGLWSVENFNYQVVANEIVGHLELKVFHPIAEVWLTRTGAAAIQIMVSKGMPATLENKIKNALESGFPKLKAECLKNAARSLGVVFGRNLNRKSGVSNDNKLSKRTAKKMKILTPEHEAIPAVLDALNNGYTIEQISGKYEITPEAMEIIKRLQTQKKLINETIQD